MLTSLLITVFALIAYVIGVMTSTRAKHVAAVATATYNDLLIVQQVNVFGARYVFSAYVEVYAAMFMHAVAVAMARVKTAVATVAADVAADVYGIIDVVTSIIDALIELATYDLPDTSTYALNVAAGSEVYSAGEYLVRDNGAWRNVYLTQHARSLMGDSADVIALSPATVTDASGSARVWTVSIA
jgi:hypothetical protein